MRLIPVSALSSWIHCPIQFYNSYVLGIEEPPKDVMILGLIKHKLHEVISQKEEPLIMSLKQAESVQETFQSAFTNILKGIVVNQANALRMVNVSLTDAFQKALPIAKFEAADRASRIIPLMQQGLSGEALWQSLMPKVKTEYSVQSIKLGIKGRIDRLECYHNSLLPVELKSGNPPKEGVWDGHRVQVAAYALLLEDHFNTAVPEAIVQYVDHNLRRSVVLNPFLREHVIEITANVKNCLESKALPKGCGRENCSACLSVEMTNRKL